MAKSTTSQGSQLLERFNKAPTGAKIGIFAGVAALLGAVYWFMFYSDLEEQLKTQTTQAKKLATEQSKLIERKKAYRELLDKKREIEEGLKKNAISLPASSELPSFFVSLQSQAIAANVQLVDWKRADEVPVETYVKVPVEMTIRGDYYQILEYFKLLYETRRIITVENLKIETPTKEEEVGLLTATFTASTFRQADTPPAPAAPAKDDKGKGGKPADDKAGDKAAPEKAPAKASADKEKNK